MAPTLKHPSSRAGLMSPGDSAAEQNALFRAALDEPGIPVVGRSNVARFGIGVLEKFVTGVPATSVEINGAPALLFGDRGVLLIDFEDGLVRNVHAVVNPEKLEFLRRQLSHSRGLSGPDW
ncbi:hypothetical protein [Streptomyces sp. NPDC051577]|uniref:hypothetical protein n=1 Tax=Streptomyces sp. NPDC051577 TaxID=3155166 RepID=UPI0034495CAB